MMLRAATCLLLALFPLGAAAQVERSYGAAAGPATTLAPGGTLAVALAASAAAAGSGSASLLRFRGEVQGLVGPRLWQVHPTLVGDVGGRLGRLELFLTGGVQLFGFASRADFTVFASFGLTGGAGIAARIGKNLLLVARTVLTWIPGDAAGKMSGPEEAAKPTYLTLSTLIGLDVRVGPSPEDAAFE
jgi:hypothetical protein